ncbi:MAG: arginase, partial [Chitinophagaceae bacterium]
NDFLSGEDVLLLGHFDFGDLKYVIENNAYSPDELIDAYRHAVIAIDEEVEAIIKAIVASNKIPIVVGGGHNNSYPILKAVSKGMFKNGKLPLAQINCISLVSHANFKQMEGRHSGNAFRYAEADGYLGKCALVGLHESNISQNVLADIHANPFVQYSTYEDIFIHERTNFTQAVAHATGFTEDTFAGIEIDLDAIEYALANSCTPSGISVLQARQYVNFAATDVKVAYLHICEGASQMADGRREENTGKLISYLVCDFVKANAART